MGIPNWRLPIGVSRGTWDYLQAKHIAAEYDNYFSQHPLLQLDIEFAIGRLDAKTRQSGRSEPPVVIDLGCGTGRVARALAPLGYRMLNIDLSPSMLREANCHAELSKQQVNVLANLAALDCLRENSIDGAVCLFSSLGMIRGRSHRVACLSDVRRSLKPGSELILHAHNRYHSIWDPRGPTWLLQSFVNSRLQQEWEYGDKIYGYRGLPKMFLHIYSRRELLKDLSDAGFTSISLTPINVSGSKKLRPGVTNSVRAGGYFAVANK